MHIDDAVVWVEVIDGVGRLEHPATDRPESVLGDPEHRILAAKRIQREEAPTTVVE